LLQSSNRTSSESRQTRRFKDLSYIRIACNRCASASVAAKSRHREDLSDMRVSNLRTVHCSIEFEVSDLRTPCQLQYYIACRIIPLCVAQFACAVSQNTHEISRLQAFSRLRLSRLPKFDCLYLQSVQLFPVSDRGYRDFHRPFVARFG
jgi:hypothetical protein